MPVEKVYFAGSFNRCTALGYDFDVDIVFTIEDYNYRDMSLYQTQVSAVLSKFRRGIEIKAFTKFCVKIIVAEFVEADLVLTGDPNFNQYRNPSRYYSGAVSEQVDDELEEFADQNTLFRPLVLFCKHWRNLDERAKQIKSFYIELMCMDILIESNASSIPALFREFLQRLISVNATVPNPNPFNGEEIGLSRKIAPEVRCYASETTRTLHKYIRPGNKTNSLVAVCSVSSTTRGPSGTLSLALVQNAVGRSTRGSRSTTSCATTRTATFAQPHVDRWALEPCGQQRGVVRVSTVRQDLPPVVLPHRTHDGKAWAQRSGEVCIDLLSCWQGKLLPPRSERCHLLQLAWSPHVLNFDVLGCM